MKNCFFPTILFFLFWGTDICIYADSTPCPDEISAVAQWVNARFGEPSTEKSNPKKEFGFNRLIPVHLMLQFSSNCLKSRITAVLSDYNVTELAVMLRNI
jgi:hypothetical protein